MRRLFWNWIISAFVLWLAAKFLHHGVHINPWWNVLWLAPLLGMINVLVELLSSLLSLLAFPVTCLTLGCFGFIISFILYALAIDILGHSPQITSFRVDSFEWAAALAVVMALLGGLLNGLVPKKR